MFIFVNTKPSIGSNLKRNKSSTHHLILPFKINTHDITLKTNDELL